jgi:hypothetical protein
MKLHPDSFRDPRHPGELKAITGAMATTTQQEVPVIPPESNNEGTLLPDENGKETGRAPPPQKMQERTFLSREEVLKHFNGSIILYEWAKPMYLCDIFQKSFFLK